MIKDEKRSYRTAKYRAPAGYDGCTIHWDAEMNKHGTQDAYFAITGQIWSPHRKDDCEACGCLHEGYIDKVELKGLDAKLPGLVRWHLTGVRSGPMHYVANSLFHLKEGKVDFFKKCCVFGAVEGDVMPESPEAAKEFLEGRFDKLMLAFERDMVDFYGESVRC